MTGARRNATRVAFLMLGEMLLAPHLWPIVVALARRDPALAIDVWVSTSVHEKLLRGWLDPGLAGVRLRRAPGFVDLPSLGHGENPPLPSKLPMLARLIPHLWRVPVVVCSEQTSLWLPRAVPASPRFIFTVHGTGPLNHGQARRLHSAYRLLIPSEADKSMHIAAGLRADRIVVTGYVKSSARPLLNKDQLFDNDRPIILYTPHWQRHRSSWWQWGREVVRLLTAQTGYNVILAPHQRLGEGDPDLAGVLQAAASPGRIHIDTASYAMVDGSYTAMADIYLGDTSSQVVEFLARPRPCVFLDPPGMHWRDMANDYGACGQVVTDLDRLPAALADARANHPRYAAFQCAFATAALGDTSGSAPDRAADAIIAALS